MIQDSVWRTIAGDKRAQIFEERWQGLCTLYLPRAPKHSIWRYHRATSQHEPECGWKLHVSATILNASKILKRIAPFLIESGVQFKAARSLLDVMQLNSGLFQAYSQIGKVITVYPRSEDEAVRLAERLHKLTRHFGGPAIPFDLRFSGSSNVYYRFGAFKQIQVEQPDGRRALVMRFPDGTLAPDLREQPVPDGMRDPFRRRWRTSRPRKAAGELASSFRVLTALTQRGKGGVYEAIDLQVAPPRLCILKEGRRNGEMMWDGRDGAWRVRNEEATLKRLSACGATVPRVYSSFEVGENYYLVMEFIEGQSLYDLLSKRGKRLPLTRVLSYGVQLARFLAQMHGAGWAWRDCKPKNLIVTAEGELIPIDFEGATRVQRPDFLIWGTPAFIPPESRLVNEGSPVTDDLYALGSILYLMLTARVFDPRQPVAIERVRSRIPCEVREVIALLLDERDSRPTAEYVCARLSSLLMSRSKKSITFEDGKAA
jgi:Protein kinase domain